VSVVRAGAGHNLQRTIFAVGFRNLASKICSDVRFVFRLYGIVECRNAKPHGKVSVTQAERTDFQLSYMERFEIIGNRLLGSPIAVLVLYVAIFSLAMLVGHGGGALHTDTTEAYAWGKELQLGYAKHPPFWAWIAYGWFSVFPTSDWAAYLLSALNSAIGLGCTYLIALRFVSRPQAMAALLCLIASPIYFCLASRFNANTVLISLWPATTLFALRAQEADRVSDGIATGLLAAACLLSKYVSVLFLPVLFFALPLRGTPAVWRSRSAIASYVALALAVLPHLIWLHTHDYQPFTYVQQSTYRPSLTSLREAVLFPIILVGLLLPAVLIYASATSARRHSWWRGLLNGWDAKRIFVTVLLFGPIVLTIATCLLRSATVKPLYVIPMVFLAPIWLAQFPGIPFDMGTLARVRRGWVGAVAFYLVAAPLVGGIAFAIGPSFATQPTADVARWVTTEWRNRYGSPLRTVAGDEDYALRTPFYSPDHPSYLAGFDAWPLADFKNPDLLAAMALTPWITTQDIVAHGLVIICSEQQQRHATKCTERARSWRAEQVEELSLTVARDLLGFRGPDYRFRIFFVAPSSHQTGSQIHGVSLAASNQTAVLPD